MFIFPLDHLPGCTPLEPCHSCKAMRLLRDKLSEEDLNNFVAGAREVFVASGSHEYSESNPAPLEAPVSILKELSVRSKNALYNDGISSIGQLTALTEHRFLRGPNVGRKSLNEVKEALRKIGHKFKEEE